MFKLFKQAIVGIFVIGLFMGSTLAWLVIVDYIFQCSLIGGITISVILLLSVVAAALIYGGGADSAEKNNEAGGV